MRSSLPAVFALLLLALPTLDCSSRRRPPPQDGASARELPQPAPEPALPREFVRERSEPRTELPAPREPTGLHDAAAEPEYPEPGPEPEPQEPRPRESQRSDACAPGTCRSLGKNCGLVKDGCGGRLSCGACTGKQFCGGGGVANVCGCKATPLGTFAPQKAPILRHAPIALQGARNIYAPDVHREKGIYWMWYGGQGQDGHDRIFLATSVDGYHWHHYPRHGTPTAMFSRGSANHVNDPSVVKVGSTYYMYYTLAQTGIDDRIHLATSTDRFTWVVRGKVLDVGASGSWEGVRVGRPSVIYEGGLFKMWYDGTSKASRDVGYATSKDGLRWTKHPRNPVFKNAGAVDVKAVGCGYVMLYESQRGTFFSASKDGLSWQPGKLLFGLSGAGYDAFGQVTPMLFVEGGRVERIYFGGASDKCWCKNSVGVALLQGVAAPPSPDKGCERCAAPGCAEACRQAKVGIEGKCGVPGSTNPGACCTCFKP